MPKPTMSAERSLQVVTATMFFPRRRWGRRVVRVMAASVWTKLLALQELFGIGDTPSVPTAGGHREADDETSCYRFQIVVRASGNTSPVSGGRELDDGRSRWG